MSKKLKDYTLDDLCDQFTREIHDELLLNGGRGMKSEIYRCMCVVLEWHREKQKSVVRSRRNARE